MSAATQRRQAWFGQILDWRYDPAAQVHTAWWDGRSHYITKVDRRTADANKITPGWHIWDPDPDPDEGWDGFGPGVGHGVVQAKRNAEAWIICSYADMMGYPRLHLALGGDVAFEHGTIRCDDNRRWFTLHPRGSTDALGAVRPMFPTTSCGHPRWLALAMPDRRIAETDSWREAVAVLGAVVAR